MSKPKRKAKGKSALKSRMLAVLALDAAIQRVRALAKQCASMTDELNGLNGFLGNMIIEGKGNIVGCTDEKE